MRLDFILNYGGSISFKSVLMEPNSPKYFRTYLSLNKEHINHKYSGESDVQFYCPELLAPKWKPGMEIGAYKKVFYSRFDC